MKSKDTNQCLPSLLQALSVTLRKTTIMETITKMKPLGSSQLSISRMVQLLEPSGNLYTEIQLMGICAYISYILKLTHSCAV